ncbi:hypothetical protein HK104_006960, partial [Borealophlyctis nickersoniae]
MARSAWNRQIAPVSIHIKPPRFREKVDDGWVSGVCFSKVEFSDQGLVSHGSVVGEDDKVKGGHVAKRVGADDGAETVEVGVDIVDFGEDAA